MSPKAVWHPCKEAVAGPKPPWAEVWKADSLSVPSQPVVASHQRVWAHRLRTVAPEGHVPAVMNKTRAWAARSQMLDCCPERLEVELALDSRGLWLSTVQL